MKNKIILLLSFLSCGLFQASDIFKAIGQHDKKAIQSWLKSNPDVALNNDQGQTVLMKAVQVNNKNLVHKLLKAGASVNVVDQFGRTALDYAVELNNKEIAKALVKHQGMVSSEVNAVKCQELVIKNYSRWQKALVLLTGGLIILAGGVALATVVLTTLMCFCASNAGFFGLVFVGFGIGSGLCYGVYRWSSHAFDKNFDHEIGVLS